MCIPSDVGVVAQVISVVEAAFCATMEGGSADDEVPEASEEIGKGRGDEDQSNDFVGILGCIQVVHLLLSTCILKDTIEELIESRLVQESEEAWQSQDS